MRNVTIIVGLRVYAAKRNILPEQTLGRGLRRMYGVGSAASGDAAGTDTPETVSVMGTPAFMEFVETIRSEGVELEHVPMGGGARREDSLVVEVETGNPTRTLTRSTSPCPASRAASSASTRTWRRSMPWHGPPTACR